MPITGDFELTSHLQIMCLCFIDTYNINTVSVGVH
jgi:hypothetical protein